MTTTPLTATGTAAGTATRTVAASAQDVVKTYGRGDAAVRALDGASLAIERGRFTAVMGPSGSGKSTLMHVLAGLDASTAASAGSATPTSPPCRSGSRTLLRRDRIGFVFQSFNLVAALTAAENIDAAARPRRPASRPGLARRARRHARPGRPAAAPAVAAVRRPAAARRRRPGPGRPGRRSSSPTSPPATSTPAPAWRCWSSSSTPPATSARRSSWSPTTPLAAAYADRAAFLADGRVVDELDSPSPPRILARMTDLTAPTGELARHREGTVSCRCGASACATPPPTWAGSCSPPSPSSSASPSSPAASSSPTPHSASSTSSSAPPPRARTSPSAAPSPSTPPWASR